jgi:hypothetical protein
MLPLIVPECSLSSLISLFAFSYTNMGYFLGIGLTQLSSLFKKVEAQPCEVTWPCLK